MSKELIDVRMPDGTIVAGVPQGTSQAEVLRRYNLMAQIERPAALDIVPVTKATRPQRPLAPIEAVAGNTPGDFLREAAIGALEPFNLRNIPSIAKGGLDLFLRMISGNPMEAAKAVGGVLAAPLAPVGEFAAGAITGDAAKMGHGAGGIFTTTVPVGGAVAKAGKAATARAVAKSALPERLMTRAAGNRAAVRSPVTPEMSATRLAIHMAADAYRRLAAPIQEKAAIALASRRSPVASNVRTATPNTAPIVALSKEAVEGPPIQHLTLPEDFPNAPVAPRTTTPTEIAKAVADERSRIASTVSQERMPLTEQPKVGVEYPGLRPFDTMMTPPVRTAPAVNRWLNVSSKAVQRGANPGQQLLADRLIGATKAETAANVKAALQQAGKKLESTLTQADTAGVRFSLEDIVTDAIDNATKRIGSPRDSAFKAQLSGILDDILQRQPDLLNVKPSGAHRLKVELGDSITWNGMAFDGPINQVLVRMYRGINARIKQGVPDVAELQDRWGNLYVADRSLVESMARDVVGRGTGETIQPLKPPKK